MSEYISEFTGQEIDERLKMAETAYNQAAEHSADGDIHTTADEKELWNSASERAATNESALAEEITRAKESEAINRSSIGLQKKNLLKNNRYSGYSETINGVTFTVNSDGSITANGKANGGGSFIILEAKDYGYVKKGAIILSGSPTTDAGYQICVSLKYLTGAGDEFHVVDSYLNNGEGLKYNLEEDSIIRQAYISFTGKAVFDNITFYPMLRYADITDSTYEEYTPSLQEQIETLRDEAETDADDLAKYILANEDAHYDLGQRLTAAEQSVADLETSVSGKANRFRKWMDGSISVDIGSATLIEISGVSTVGIAHRHYLKLVRNGTETAVLEESKGAGTGVSYTYTIEDNILTVTNTGTYGHNITVIY